METIQRPVPVQMHLIQWIPIVSTKQVDFMLLGFWRFCLAWGYLILLLKYQVFFQAAGIERSLFFSSHSSSSLSFPHEWDCGIIQYICSHSMSQIYPWIFQQDEQVFYPNCFSCFPEVYRHICVSHFLSYVSLNAVISYLLTSEWIQNHQFPSLDVRYFQALRKISPICP